MFVDQTGRRLSKIGIDHAHEQKNKEVKSAGGAIGLTHDPASLRRFSIGAPEVSRLLKEYRGQKDCDEDDQLQVQPHHEEKKTYQLRFLDKCNALKDSFLEGENPFLVTGELLIAIDTRVVMEDDAVTALFNAESQGLSMMNDFLKERLIGQTKSVYDPIKKSQIAIFTSRKKGVLNTPLKAMRANSQNFCRMFIISTAREFNLNEFFSYENENTPPSISLNGEIRAGNKAPLVTTLEDKLPSDKRSLAPSSCDGVVFDGAVLVHTVKPASTIKSFKDYVSQLAKYIKNRVAAVSAQRVDIVWDMYSNESLKGFTRDGRGFGIRRHNLPTKGMR